MSLHKDLTGADLHEPKGITGASSPAVYIANGSGSGTWRKVAASEVTLLDAGDRFIATNVEDALIENFKSIFTIDGRFTDVSTPSTILFPIPVSCTVVSIEMVLGGNITAADDVISVSRSDGASLGTQTITQAGSTEGTSFSFVPTGNAVLTYPTHRYLKLVTDGASGTAQPLYVTVYLTRN